MTQTAPEPLPAAAARPAPLLQQRGVLARDTVRVVPQPALVNRMILTRQTCFWGQLRSAAIASRRVQSDAVTSKVIPVRMHRDSHGSRRKGI